ncbi:hypothetical protein E2493_14575 [Sphingomonas parva]|uniref:Rap1a immunity protein domain-containing protein n=1 Tax=Sphingomonas parva TaxID=2555898 RepID=A0A4Y8ZQ41_9SPHN|nr:Rap1a/Tai family immunity protein [Sphingomonas parva]TFI57587.1 hypothetical protein E2493_14575 [Sphingomonas parva]
MIGRMLAWLTAAALALAPGLADAQAVLPRYEDGIVASNAFWFLEECRSNEPLRLARCDGFIQGVAATLRAQRWPRSLGKPNCQLEFDSARLREAVLTHMKSARSPAPGGIVDALNTAFPCELPPR